MLYFLCITLCFAYFKAHVIPINTPEELTRNVRVYSEIYIHSPKRLFKEKRKILIMNAHISI